MKIQEIMLLYDYNYWALKRILWRCLIHVVNHGTQHQSEAAAILTAYDQTPGEPDFTIFLNESA